MSEYVTIQQLAARLGVSPSEIRRREALGQIKPSMKRKSKHGKPLHLYKEVMVERLSLVVGTNRRKGAKVEGRDYAKLYHFYPSDAAKVYPMLRDRVPLDQIVIETKLHPGVVQAILAEYVAMTGAMLVPGWIMDEINSLTLDGNFPIKTAEDLLEVLAGCAKNLCTVCKRRPRNICRGCIMTLVDEEEIV